MPESFELNEILFYDSELTYKKIISYVWFSKKTQIEKIIFFQGSLIESKNSPFAHAFLEA